MTEKEEQARKLIEAKDGYQSIVEKSKSYDEYPYAFMQCLFEDLYNTYAHEELAEVAKNAILNHCQDRIKEAETEIEKL